VNHITARSLETFVIMKIAIGAVTVLVIAIVAKSFASHSEDALMGDWSAPPPWPIFIAVNSLAGLLRSAADALTPPPIRAIELTYGFYTSKLLHICEEFKIADFLATGPKTIAEIAEYTGTKDALRVERIMYAMAADGITKLDPSNDNTKQPRFVNSPLSAVLRRDHPNSMAGFVGHSIEDGFVSFGGAENALGPDAIDVPWEVVYTQYKGQKLWALFEDKPVQEEQFGRAMNALEGLGGYAMAMDGPFAKFDRVIDVGGSLGHFLYKILKTNPEQEGVLFDRPQVLANAKTLWSDEGAYSDEQGRVEMIEGSFFNVSNIPRTKGKGDVYVMRYILHDWSDEESLGILKNLRQAMVADDGSVATLVIGESAIPDRDQVGVPAAMHKIDMVMMNFFGDALERTPKMWKELLADAGFDVVGFHPTRSLVHFVEAVPRV
jgi:O-methyltransferase domain